MLVVKKTRACREKNKCPVLRNQCIKSPLVKVNKFLFAASLSLWLSAILMMAEGEIRPGVTLLTFTNKRLSYAPTVITILDCNYSLLLNFSAVSRMPQWSRLFVTHTSRRIAYRITSPKTRDTTNRSRSDGRCISKCRLLLKMPLWFGVNLTERGINKMN